MKVFIYLLTWIKDYRIFAIFKNYQGQARANGIGKFEGIEMNPWTRSDFSNSSMSYSKISRLYLKLKYWTVYLHNVWMAYPIGKTNLVVDHISSTRSFGNSCDIILRMLFEKMRNMKKNLEYIL